MCGIIGNISKNKSIGETQLKNLIRLSKQIQFRDRCIRLLFK